MFNNLIHSLKSLAILLFKMLRCKNNIVLFDRLNYYYIILI